MSDTPKSFCWWEVLGTYRGARDVKFKAKIWANNSEDARREYGRRYPTYRAVGVRRW